MEKANKKTNLLVPVGLFTIFLTTGIFRLYEGIIKHDTLHVMMSVAGIMLSLAGIIIIANYFIKHMKVRKA